MSSANTTNDSDEAMKARNEELIKACNKMATRDMSRISNLLTTEPRANVNYHSAANVRYVFHVFCRCNHLFVFFSLISIEMDSTEYRL
jgi:hypothetical protein